MNETLINYVTNQIRAGNTKSEIQEQLVAVGWSEEESLHVYKTALIALGLPVPVEGNRQAFVKKASTVDVVVNFFSFILLGITTFSLGTLLYQIINKYIADPLDATKYYSYDTSWQTEVIHYSIAALLIAYPLYVFTMRIWFKKFRENEGRSESKLTKWLTYLVLLVAAVTVVGDLITIVFRFLQGEVTMRFFTKALTVFVIATVIFVFYYLERKKVQYQANISRSVFLSFGVLTTTIVAFAIVLGFFAGGSPTEERNRAFDMSRSNDLSDLSNCVESYVEKYSMLPDSLDDLKTRSIYCNARMQDPVTATPYSYRVITRETMRGNQRVGEYELCATFALSSDKNNNQPYRYNNLEQWFDHEAGQACDTAEVVIRSPKIPNTITAPPVIVPYGIATTTIGTTTSQIKR